jgi:hypothetical protein
MPAQVVESEREHLGFVFRDALSDDFQRLLRLAFELVLSCLQAGVRRACQQEQSRGPEHRVDGIQPGGQVNLRPPSRCR